MAQHVDDLCFIKSVHTEGVAHGPATLCLHTGATASVRPSMGSWVTYGLGTENQNLPGFITISPTANMGGPRNYSNAFLPAVYQGTVLGHAGLPATQARFKHISNPSASHEEQRKQFDLLQALNREQVQQSPGDSNLEAAIDSFELAWRMQMNAPKLTDLSNESPATLKLLRHAGRSEHRRLRPAMPAGATLRGSRRALHPGKLFRQRQQPEMGSAFEFESARDARACHRQARLTGFSPISKNARVVGGHARLVGRRIRGTPFSEGTLGRDHNPTGFTVWLTGSGE